MGIRCCVNNLMRHQYGEILNEMQAEGMEIELDRCQSRCAGCLKQAAFMTEEQWYGFDSKEEFRAAVQGIHTAIAE